MSEGNFMDGLSVLSSPSRREVLGLLDQNKNGLNPISEMFPQTNISPDPQPEQRSACFRDRMAARLGFNIPSLEIKNVSPFANPFRNPILVPSPILVISPGFSLSPFLQSPNMLSNSSSQIIPPCSIPNDVPPEKGESLDGTHATIIISNNNLPHQPMNVNLPAQGGSDDIPTEESVYITSLESNADPIAAPLVPSFDSELVAEADVMNHISLESGSKDNDEDRDYNQEKDKIKDHNIVVEPPSRKRKSQDNIEETMVSNIIGATRQKNKTQSVLIQVESEEDHPEDGFRWRKYGRKIVTGNANPRSYYRCTYTGCKVTKLVERSVENVKFVVATYDGIHEHVPPPERKTKSGKKNQSGSSSASQIFPSALSPQLNGTSLPVDKKHTVMNRNDEPYTERVIPDGTEVFKGITERLFHNFGTNL